jgi:hypothetical protein
VKVKNDDEKCFLWSVLADKYSAWPHPDRVSNYRKHFSELNAQGLQFPLAVTDVKKFENLNPTFSVNVFSFEKGDIAPLYVTPLRERDTHVNLLLIHNKEKMHYLLIKDLSRFVAGRSLCTRKAHVCPYCLHCFWQEEVLSRHLPECEIHPPQRIRYPQPDNNILSFKATQKQFPVQFAIYADFESFLPSVDDEKTDQTTVLSRHEPSGFGAIRVSTHSKYNSAPFVYSDGPDVIDQFFSYLQREEKFISDILSDGKLMIPLTEVQELEHDRAVTCSYCTKPFTSDNPKTTHHSHLSGQYLSPACQACNLNLKPLEMNDTEGNKSFFIPVVAHNARSYDFHLMIKHFQRKFAETKDKKGNVKLNDIKVIPSNNEKFLSFQIGNLRFVDSIQFLNSSLDTLVSNLAKGGLDEFVHTRAEFPDSTQVFEKGVYPYEYMTDRTKFDETCLPDIKQFFSKLTDSDITEDDYRRAQSIWTEFNCKTMKDYHDHYLKTDVLLLADVFEAFRVTAMDAYKLDPLHYYSLPGFSWDACLLKTGVKLELITDEEQSLFIENSMRGGISTITHRYAKANNEFHPDDFDSQSDKSYLMYLDCNNLYGTALADYLPTGGFRFLFDWELDIFDVKQIPDDFTKGYFIECDLEYPDELHDSHNDYPLAAERLTVTPDMLSPFCRSFSKNHIQSEKLIPNLRNKKNYILHYRNLKLYLDLGMKLTAVHRVLEFDQSPWMKPFIDFNTAKRIEAMTEFARSFFKLVNNSCFGKTIENLRKRVNVKLITCPIRFKKHVAKPTFKKFTIVNEDLVLVEMARAKLTMNKPIYIGYTVLELSKALMYDFHYNQIASRYKDNARLLFTDTDSLCYKIITQDVYADMSQNLDMYDTSNYSPDHKIYSPKNSKVLGKFKDECGGKPPLEFVGLRAKMYSLLESPNSKPKMTAKGVQRSFVSKHVRHEMFLKTLHNKSPTMAKFCSVRSFNHA